MELVPQAMPKGFRSSSVSSKKDTGELAVVLVPQRVRVWASNYVG